MHAKQLERNRPGHEDHACHSPLNINDTGLSFYFLVELLAKIFYRGGPLRLSDLVNRSRLPASVIEPLLGFMRSERLCELNPRIVNDSSELYYTLTDLGRQRAEELSRSCQYAGAAPVSLDAYIARVKRQAITHMRVTRKRIAQVFSGIVVKPEIMNQLGAAMNSGRAVFMYGPAGSGKTYLGEQLGRLLTGYIYIPHALNVDGEVVQIFDPLIHKPVTSSSKDVPTIDRGATMDERWVLCERPVAVAGGELTLGMLDLEFDHGTRFYSAPPQVKANNGLLIIDDLGRQLVQPRELMNRWIVPLDRRVDYLALHTGKKFMVPFDVNIIFCTNLKPSTLADDAFLRRLGYKIHVGPLRENEYRNVFKQVCEERSILFTEEGFDYVLEKHAKSRQPLLACYPRDLIGQLADNAHYTGVAAELNEPLLDWAWDNYFVNE